MGKNKNPMDYLPPWMFQYMPPFMHSRQPRPPPNRFLRPIQFESEEEEEDLVPPFIMQPPFFPRFRMPPYPTQHEDDYPPPEFMSLPPPNYLFQHLPRSMPPPPLPGYAEDADDGSRNRRRREALLESYDVHDPAEWWNDIDGGSKNKITQKLTSTKTGIAAQQMMLSALDTFSPALHVGEIDTGYLRNPELGQASDRTFGEDSDFHMSEMTAFEFTPQGERIRSLKEFYDMVKSGALPLGQRYILHKLFFSNCFGCGVNKDVKKVKNILHVINEVNFADNNLNSVYWHEVECDGLWTGEYLFLGIKKYKGYKSWSLAFQHAASGQQIFVVNPNINGMQAMSPYNGVSAARGLYNKHEGSTMYLSSQADVADIYNSAYTKTGTRFGKEQLPTYKLAKANRPRYDESRVWTKNTWLNNPIAGFQQYAHNERKIGRRFQSTNQYHYFK